MGDRGEQYGPLVGGDQPFLLDHAAAQTDSPGVPGVQVPGLSGGGRAGISVPVRSVPARRVSDHSLHGLRGGPAPRVGPRGGPRAAGGPVVVSAAGNMSGRVLV